VISIEKGEHDPVLELTFKIAELCDVTIKDIFIHETGTLPELSELPILISGNKYATLFQQNSRTSACLYISKKRDY
jgi:DNA-binding XRE family transcriptional regulator